MALALTVDSLDSVPEAARGAYVADGDKFKLDFEVEDTTNLKSALEKERKTAREMTAKVRKWESLGKSDEEIAALIAAQAEDESVRLKKKGDFDAILKQHTDKAAKEKADLVSELNAARASERGAIIETSVMGALTKAKATATGLRMLSKELSARINLETVDGKRVIQIMQADGKTPMAGSGEDGTATFDDLVKETIKDFPDLFEGTGAGGGGTPPKNAGGAGKATMTAKEFGALDAKAKAAAATTPGFKLVD